MHPDAQSGGSPAPSSGDPSSDPVRDLVHEALAETNALRPEGERVGLQEEAPLAAPEGPLDSLGIVNLVAALEGRVQARWSRSAELMEALGRPLEESPFRTVGTLVEHLRTTTSGEADA